MKFSYFTCFLPNVGEERRKLVYNLPDTGLVLKIPYTSFFTYIAGEK